MAKNQKPETSFQRFQKLAKRIVRAPKEKAQQQKGDNAYPKSGA